MSWYYALESRKIGPLSEEEFQNLVQSGVVGAGTLVWREGLKDWREYGLIQAGAAGVQSCAECGRAFPEEEMIRYGEVFVCPDCKPVFVQKLKEGLHLAGVMEYAGFWIRAGAKIIDWMILGAFQLILTLATALGLTIASELALMIVMNVLQIAFAATYNTIMIGRYGATVGKLACQIKVVSEEGRPVSYPRALGRHFAEMLSGLILGIGYLMVAFDDENRALHDRICGTRVIKK
ncbi:MAG: RDD family protein [Thermodesulfobacteriota bacterium]